MNIFFEKLDKVSSEELANSLKAANQQRVQQSSLKE